MAHGSEVRSVQLVAHGAPLEVRSVQLRAPRDGETVLEMVYAGVNPIDRYIALGRVAPQAPLARTVGVEGSGRTPDGRLVAVHGHGLGTARPGVWAEAAVVPLDALVPVPDGVDPRAAAAMGVAGATAWRTVHELARVGPDDRVLVLGASGGVGSMVVSLVHSIGATVWGQTGHHMKAAAVSAAGADRVVVAGADEVVPSLGDLCPTVVFDPLGGEFTAAAATALAAHGRLVLFGTSAGTEGPVPLQGVYRKGLSILGYGGLIEPPDAVRRGIEGALGALVDGSLRIAIDSALPLEGANEALERIARRSVSGKVVLDAGA